ncbi:MAG: hypothetical protein M0Q53_19665 [Prolixibacteraceae bacterium]|jgi:hypothetical protein|nr:hypothetical protein [Prolixibacteraceae bacterium]
MTVIELRQRLIGKINATEDNELLEEMYRLIANEEIADSVYKLSDDQNYAIEEAQKQFKEGQFFKSERAGILSLDEARIKKM